MRHNLAAYPSYLSVNTVDGSTDVEFTVRSEQKSDGSCGDTVNMRMSAEDFKKVVAELLSHVEDTMRQSNV